MDFEGNSPYFKNLPTSQKKSPLYLAIILILHKG